MAADGISPALAIRSSVGVELWHTIGANKTYTPNEQFARDESKFCRAIEFSPDGQYLAWANGSKVQIAQTNSWNIICSLPRPKTFSIKFSPKGTYLATLEHFSTPKDGSSPQPNFYVYRSNTGEIVYSIINKSFPDDWMPGWSSDESLFALIFGGEALFFETESPTGYTKPAMKIGGQKHGAELSIAGSGNSPHIALYVPGVKGQPSVCKIFRYPSLDATQVVASKSFYQADRVEMMWNKRASAMILMTSTEVDSTGASYYGKQALHFLNTKGDSCSVPLSKEGPIHAVQWNPKGNEFCVIYGYMPSKATFFNMKCDPIFEVNEAPRNSIYFNPFGNIVLLAGFGNLRGNVEVWDANEKKLITTFQAPDSTLLEWGPDGETILTATTAPRLRIGNGFKVWHYSGALLHETVWPAGQELNQVAWQRYPDGVFTEKPISNVKVQGIEQSQVKVSRYVPPHARGGNNVAPPPTRSSVQLANNNGSATEKAPIPGLPIGYKVSQGQRKKERDAKRVAEHKKTMNKTDVGNGKQSSNIDSNSTTPQTQSQHQGQNQSNPSKTNNRRRNNKQQQQNGGGTQNDNHNNQTNPSNVENVSTNINNRPKNAANNTNNIDGQPDHENNGEKTMNTRTRRRNNRNKETHIAISTGDPEKDKQIRARIRIIQQKLRDIVKLKTKRENGENIDANQLSKINTENDLVKELNALRISA